MSDSGDIGTLRRPAAWLNGRFGPQGLLFTAALVTGIASGAAAALLKTCIGALSNLFTSHFHTAGPNWGLLVIPVLGIVLTGIFQRYILRHDVTHGVRKLNADLNRDDYVLPPYLCFGPMCANTLTLGAGGSAGSEGPIAYTGAALGSNIGRMLGINGRMLMIMVGCGAGAGIAGIFKAPVGGMLFALEVLKLELTTASVMALLLACLAAALTAYVLSGFTVDLSYLQIQQFDAAAWPALIVMAALCGLYSVYYSDIMRLMERFYTRLRSPWVRNVVSGSVLAVILLAFPAMYGEGYGVMGRVLNGRLDALVNDSVFAAVDVHGLPVVLITLGIVMLKAFACSASNCGGGVGGDFAPTLFAGCILGFCFATACNLWLGTDLPVGGFAFCGMAGVMAGVIRAPFMALFLTAEMTNGYILLLPLLVVAGISFGTVRLFRPQTFYKTI